MRFIARPHLCRTPRGAHLGHWYFISPAAAAVAANATNAAATVSGGTTAF